MKEDARDRVLFKKEVSNIHFGLVKPMDMTIMMEGEIIYIELTRVAEDLLYPNCLMFSTPSFLATFSPLQETIFHLSGTKVLGFKDGNLTVAQFNYISDFIQIDQVNILAVDKLNHCIRKIRRFNETSTFAGMCQTAGDTDGGYLNATFFKPSTLDIYNGVIYVADAFGIRKLDDGDVTTLLKDRTIRHSIVFYPLHNLLYYTADSFIGRINLESAKNELFAGSISETGFSDGLLLDARFSSIHGLTFINKHVLLVSDMEQGNLRVIDILHKRTSSICNTFEQPNETLNESRNVKGDINNCELSSPLALDVRKRHWESEVYRIEESNLFIQKPYSEVIVSTSFGIMSLQLFKGEDEVLAHQCNNTTAPDPIFYENLQMHINILLLSALAICVIHALMVKRKLQRLRKEISKTDKDHRTKSIDLIPESNERNQENIEMTEQQSAEMTLFYSYHSPVFAKLENIQHSNMNSRGCFTCTLISVFNIFLNKAYHIVLIVSGHVPSISSYHSRKENLVWRIDTVYSRQNRFFVSLFPEKHLEKSSIKQSDPAYIILSLPDHGEDHEIDFSKSKEIVPKPENDSTFSFENIKLSVGEVVEVCLLKQKEGERSEKMDSVTGYFNKIENCELLHDTDLSNTESEDGMQTTDSEHEY